MFQQINPNEMPGVGTGLINLNRAVWLGRQGVQYLPGGGRICGPASRDPSNVAGYWEAGTYAAQLPPNQAAAVSGVGPYMGTLQAGLLMGVISSYAGDAGVTLTSLDNNKYAPSIFGLTGAAITNGFSTSVQVPAAVGAEILRRVGQTGTIYLVGPATTGATQTVNVQALTLTSITQNGAVYWTLNFSTWGGTTAVIGSLLCPYDGSQDPVTFVDEIDGIRVTDASGNSLGTVQFPRIPIGGGVVNTDNLINYTSGLAVTATALVTQTTEPACQTWIRSMLNSQGSTGSGSGGKFTFSGHVSQLSLEPATSKQ